MEKNKIGNFLKEKKEENKLVTGVLGVTLLHTIHSATVKNTLFEDDDDANTFRAFNTNQAFLHLKKKIVMNSLQSVSQYTSYYVIT